MASTVTALRLKQSASFTKCLQQIDTSGAGAVRETVRHAECLLGWCCDRQRSVMTSCV